MATGTYNQQKPTRPRPRPQYQRNPKRTITESEYETDDENSVTSNFRGFLVRFS